MRLICLAPTFARSAAAYLYLAFAAAVFQGGAAAQKISITLDPTRLDGHSLLEVLSASSDTRPYERSPAELPTLWGLLNAIQDSGRFSADETKEQLRYQEREIAARLRAIVRDLDDKTLLGLARGDGKTRGEMPFLREPVMQRWIEKEVAKILREPKRATTFPDDPPPLPEYFAYGERPAAEMRECARAASPFLRLLDAAAKTKRGIYAETDDYSKFEAQVWRGGRKGLADELLRFSWDSWCGTGADGFFQAQTEAVLLSLLRERRIAEALGASLRLRPNLFWLHEPGKPLERWRYDLANYCGFDPETLLLVMDHKDLLAANGSERGARAMLLAVRAKLEKKESVFSSDWQQLAAFLPPGLALKYDPGSDVREQLPAPLQQEILATLEEALRDDLPLRVLDENLAVFADLQRLETKAALHRVLARPSHRFAEKAARVLRAMGEDIPIIPPDPPVRFRLTLNGQPWASHEISCSLQRKDYPPGSTDYKAAETLKTDAEGGATIARDFFLDPTNVGTELTFSHIPQGEEGRETGDYTQPWLHATCPMPTRFDGTIHVDIEACPLTVELEYFPAPPNPKLASTTVRLTKADKVGVNDWNYRVDFRGDIVAPKRLVFTTLQPGLYRLLVLAPGSAQWLSEPIDLQPGREPVRVKLEQGADIYASIFAPANARGVGIYRLFKDGADVSERFGSLSFQDRRPLFAGLPRGRYQFRALSSKEYMEANRIKAWEEPETFGAKPPRKWVECEAVAVDFSVDETTPPLLDLGRVEIPVAAEMRELAEPPRQLSLGLPVITPP